MSDGTGVVDQMVFRWAGSRGATRGAGITAVAYSCDERAARDLADHRGSVLRVKGGGGRTSVVRLIHGDLAVLLRRMPDTDGTSRESNMCHALMAPAGTLTARLCLALGSGPWEEADWLDAARGRIEPFALKTVQEMADRRRGPLKDGVPLIREPLVPLVAELLRAPGGRVSARIGELEAAADAARGALPGAGARYAETDEPPPDPALSALWALCDIFGNWLGNDGWTYATYDTSDAHPHRVVFVPDWRRSHAQDNDLRRIKLTDPHRDRAADLAEMLVDHYRDWLATQARDEYGRPLRRAPDAASLPEEERYDAVERALTGRRRRPLPVPRLQLPASFHPRTPAPPAPRPGPAYQPEPEFPPGRAYQPGPELPPGRAHQPEPEPQPAPGASPGPAGAPAELRPAAAARTEDAPAADSAPPSCPGTDLWDDEPETGADQRVYADLTSWREDRTPARGRESVPAPSREPAPTEGAAKAAARAEEVTVVAEGLRTAHLPLPLESPEPPASSPPPPTSAMPPALPTPSALPMPSAPPASVASYRQPTPPAPVGPGLAVPPRPDRPPASVPREPHRPEPARPSEQQWQATLREALDVPFLNARPEPRTIRRRRKAVQPMESHVRETLVRQLCEPFGPRAVDHRRQLRNRLLAEPSVTDVVHILGRTLTCQAQNMVLGTLGEREYTEEELGELCRGLLGERLLLRSWPSDPDPVLAFHLQARALRVARWLLYWLVAPKAERHLPAVEGFLAELAASEEFVDCQLLEDILVRWPTDVTDLPPSALRVAVRGLYERHALWVPAPEPPG
ncbi:hypothetical protein ACIA8I_21765 [Streptomyces rishiriensis]|uniref:hypothetical protein n=1 Tax=Streptomyces rishiriensis TaxID=68264 RepID=UPI0037A62CE2